MNAFYRWLPDGPSMPAHDENHARGKIQEAYADAHFERHDELAAAGACLTLAWPDLAAHKAQSEPIAEIFWSA